MSTTRKRRIEESFDPLLPSEIWLHIFTFLPEIPNLPLLTRVCTQWRQIILESDSLWKCADFSSNTTITNVVIRKYIQHWDSLHELNLSNCNKLSSSIMIEISANSKLCKGLTFLQLQNTKLAKCPLDSFVSLTKLNISCTNANNRTLKVIGNVLPLLVYLDISATMINFEGIHELQSLSVASNIQALVVSKCWLLRKKMSYKPTSGFPNLKVFYGDNITCDGNDLGLILHSSSKLEIFHVNVNTRRNIQDFLTQSCFPEVFAVTFHKLSHAETMLISTVFPAVETLDVSESIITMDVLKDIVNKCGNLKYIKLESCRDIERHLRSASVDQIRQYLNKNVD